LTGNTQSSSSSSNRNKAKRKKYSSTNKRRHKEKRSRSKRDARKTKELLSGVKAKTPFTYTGTASLDLLDQWTYAMDVWFEMNGLDNKWAVKLMINFLSEKAGTFYMKHVALHRHRWSIKQVYEGLFDYCFPPDYKLELRKRLMNAYQGKRMFRDFARDVEALAKRFPDVPKRQLVQIIWDGAQQFIRLKWIESGYSPESTRWKKLVQKAGRYEAAETLRVKERSKPPFGGRVFEKSETKRDAKTTNAPQRVDQKKTFPKKDANPVKRGQQGPKESRPKLS
jgi:hypothetical protein